MSLKELTNFMFMFKMSEEDKSFFKLIKKKPWILILMLLSALIMTWVIGD
tara:strand:+ start:51 stop:200 length:150 start_codon:yes stop_codon:yes gene_type:complete